MSGGTWDPTNLPVRPGAYLNFERAALANITGGARGIVGLPVFTYTGTAVAGKFYAVEKESEANALFGANNTTAIKRVLEGGSKTVLAYAVPPAPTPGEEDEPASEATRYTNIRDAFEAEYFNVFAYPTLVPDTEQTATKAWVARNRAEGKHFAYVAGGTEAADADSTLGNARSALLKDEYIINLITGGVLPDGTKVQSADYAPYVAGLIAGTPINQAITYLSVPLADVTKRLKNSEITTALIAGSLVFVKDGDEVIIEQGVTTDSNEDKRGKIRVMRGKQAIATDIPATLRRTYIGRLDNDPGGQATVLSYAKKYMETMEASKVLMDFTVAKSEEYPSVGDSMFIDIGYTEIDSMERVSLTIRT